MVQEAMILKRNRTTGWTTLLHLLLLPVLLMVGCGWLFTSCSDDVDDMPVPTQIEESVPETDMALMSMLPAMKDAAAKNGVRRAPTWEIPTTSYTTFYDYDALYTGIANYQSLTTKAVDVFFTTGTDASRHGRLHYNKTQGWKLTLNDGSDPTEIPTGDYYVYGFVPRNAADNANIELLPGDGKTYADGAKLTLYGMPSVMSDACVIIGARDGFKTVVSEDTTYYDGGWTDTNSNTVYDDGTDTRTNRLQAGDFKFNFKKDDKGKLDNCMFLLFDHLCAALNINYKIDETYNTLRTIRLKKIHMKTATGEGDAITITKKTDVTITLNHTTDGVDPIESVTYTPTGVVSTGNDVFTSEAGVEMLTTPQTFVGHFMPAGTTTVILTSTYDVYDKNASSGHPEGNLIRKDCVATNTIRLTDLISHFEATERGKKYTLNLTIQPTFLYVMSEPDLENPTMTIE